MFILTFSYYSVCLRGFNSDYHSTDHGLLCSVIVVFFLSAACPPTHCKGRFRQSVRAGALNAFVVQILVVRRHAENGWFFDIDSERPSARGLQFVVPTPQPLHRPPHPRQDLRLHFYGLSLEETAGQCAVFRPRGERQFSAGGRAAVGMGDADAGF